MKRMNRQHEAIYSEIKRLLIELPFYWLNSKLGLINKKTFLWETSSNQGSKQIDFSPFSYVLIMISISTYTTQCMIVPTYLKSLSALGIQTQVGLYSQNEYVYANITYDGTTFSFSSNKNVLLDVIGIQWIEIMFSFMKINRYEYTTPDKSDVSVLLKPIWIWL